MLELVAGAPLAVDVAASPFGPDDVIVVSGGARGVTAEVAGGPRRGRPAGARVARSQSAPAAEPPNLAGLCRRTVPEADARRNDVRRDAATGRRSLFPILAGREIRRTLDRLAAAGGRAEYHPVDVRDANAVADLLANVRRTIGPITGIVHGAGVLADRRIDDQSDEQFDTVYSTKVAGLKALLAATRRRSA